MTIAYDFERADKHKLNLLYFSFYSPLKEISDVNTMLQNSLSKVFASKDIKGSEIKESDRVGDRETGYAIIGGDLHFKIEAL